MLFVALITMSLICTIASEIWTARSEDKAWYLGFEGMLLCFNFYCSLAYILTMVILV